MSKKRQAPFVTYGKGHALFAWTVTGSIRDNVPLSRQRPRRPLAAVRWCADTGSAAT